MMPRWRPELFHPRRNFDRMSSLYKLLLQDLPPDLLETYHNEVRRHLLGYFSMNELDRWAKATLPAAAVERHNDLFLTIIDTCHVDDSLKGDSVMTSRVDAALPSASVINALLLLDCLRNGIEFPNGDPGLLINNTLRNMMMERIETAIRVAKTHAASEHGFLRYFGRKPDTDRATTSLDAPTKPNLFAKDFFDSLLLTDTAQGRKMETEMENCESQVNFYHRMMQLSSPDVKNNDS